MEESSHADYTWRQIQEENTCTRSIETHHGGDSQISKAYPQVDRTPANRSKVHEHGGKHSTCLLVPLLRSAHSEPKH
jgi:hypothetical protein